MRKKAPPEVESHQDESPDEVPHPSAVMPTLRDALQGLVVRCEETEYATGYNQGLVEAMKLVDERDRAARSANIGTLALDDLRIAYRELHDLHNATIAAALAALRADGKKTGGDVPYGFRVDKDGQTLLEDEHEQAVILEARELHAAGYSLRGIARELWNKRMWSRAVTQGAKGEKGANSATLKSAKRGSKPQRRIGEFDAKQISRILQPAETTDG
jgi:hypothetical protein